MSNRQATATTNYDGLWGRQIREEAERKRRMKEPTPRPWKWLPKEGQVIVDTDRNIAAEIPCQGANPRDGAFIVKAVNERDALIAERDRLEAEREALSTLLRSLIPRLCSHCRNGVFPLREWGDGKAFTHWGGYEQLACAASDVRMVLARAALSGKEGE